MATLRFDANVPLEVALKFDTGKRVASRFEGSPDQVMYTSCTGETMYVPLAVEEQIQKLGIRRNEPISICKRVSNGSTRWEVKRVSDAAEPAVPFTPIPTPIDATPMERTLTQSVNLVRHQKAQQVVPAPAGPAYSQANRNESPKAQPDSTAAAVRHTVISKIMAGALIAAIDATLEAELYAESKSLEISFGAEDIRAIAATIFIQASKAYPFDSQAPAGGGAQQWRQ